MILVIDNYDSFTYNLVHYIGECDQEVLVKRNDALTVSEIHSLNPEKIVISQVPAHQMRLEFLVRLLKNLKYHY
jgi:anthranilate/para-aminobenzoate synthase component II